MNEDRDTHARTGRRHRLLQAILALLSVLVAAEIVAVLYTLRHAEPILRTRVIQALSSRFDSQVQLGEFHVSIRHGLSVEGENLSLRSNLEPALPPQIVVRQFRFHARLLDMFHSPMHIGLVEVRGLVVRIPPAERRAEMVSAENRRKRLAISIDRVLCTDALLLMIPADPNRVPLRFAIRSLSLWSVGPGHPMRFQASLLNPRPVGEIATAGNFGPWHARHPGNTPIAGIYSFTNADLSTTKGIAGKLSSSGRFAGKLDTIAVDGSTDTPDFSLHISGRQVALHTNFHAIVNGTNGDTYLQPVHAHFLNTFLTATGYVVRAHARKGHDIYLNVSIDRGRVEDLLLLGVKAGPPVMSGALQMKTKFELKAGAESVSRRVRMAGTFQTENVTFSNRRLQKRIDELSLRSQGRVREAKLLEAQSQTAVPLPDIPARMQGDFQLQDRDLTLPRLVCTVPGTEIQLAGNYTLDGKEFDFTGKARMDAHVSQMVGGWQGALLRPLNRLFTKNGANTQVAIRIRGTQSRPHIGISF